MTEPADGPLQRWAKVLDQSRCIGCHACTTACKSENEVPIGVTRTYVKSVEIGIFPQVRRAFQVTRCNQCADAPCVSACPTQAMFRRPDGIVDFDKSVCIGCKACIAACPYDAIFMNPDDNSAEKCNLCAHRLEVGLEPACVTVCPTEAILVGDLNDPESKVAQIVQREAVTVRRPEKGTRPGLFYKGAHQATLDPLAARRLDGGLLVPLLLILAGQLSWNSPLARWAAPGLALAFLGATGVLLIWDLRHPWRCYLIFTRHHWRSWLVRGSFIIGGYGAALAVYLAGSVVLRQVAAGFVIPLASPRRATPRTCSRRPGPGTCGRARCWPRTWPCRPCWPAPPGSCRSRAGSARRPP